MVENGAGADNICMQVYQIQHADIYHQSHGYFGLEFIVNVVHVLPKPLVLSTKLNLATSEQ